jgi:pheromone shutdown-related protein TraB
MATGEIRADRDYGGDVHVLGIGGREILLVGTAHVSRESADLVRRVIETERPDGVCVELDRQRHEALSQQRRFAQLDLKQVIRNRQLAPLFANLVLAAYQRKLGGALGVIPGTELLEAVRAAEELGIPVALCDRDIRVTLRRVWGSLSLWKQSLLMSTLLVSLFERPQLDEDALRRLREQDVLTELMRELALAMPGLVETLIHERDAYLARRILDAPGERLVVVVGAGHVPGIRTALESGARVDLAQLDTIPPVSPVFKAIGWSVPALILAGLAWIGVAKGAHAAGENLWHFVLATGTPVTIGALLSLAHPAVILAAFPTAPFTSLSPVIGAGHVLAFLQAYLRPPLVGDFDTLADDVSSLRRWWQSRLLRILLVFLLTTLGGLIGTWVGGYGIVSNLP